MPIRTSKPPAPATPMWCKKCKAVFMSEVAEVSGGGFTGSGGSMCPERHANFM